MSAKSSSPVSKSMNPTKWTKADWAITAAVVAVTILVILWLLGVFDSVIENQSAPGTVTTTTPTPTPSSRISGTHF